MSACDSLVCCIGCLSLCPGLLKRVVNQVAFFPPKPPGYHITEDRQVFLVEDYGLAPLPDLSAEGITVDTVKLWTRTGNVILAFHLKRSDSRRTLLFSHGNSTDIGNMFSHLRELSAKLRVDVFAYEYSGYGESSGLPGEDEMYADIEAAYNYLTNDCGVMPECVVCYGQSIGSVPSVELSSKNKVGGLILHSALTSGLNVVHPVKYNWWFDVFQNKARIGSVAAPTFIIHGTHDAEIPWDHGQALYEAVAPEYACDPWWVREAGHNDIELNYKSTYFDRLDRFLKDLEAPQQMPLRPAHGYGGELEMISAAEGRQPLLTGPSIMAGNGARGPGAAARNLR